jgi:hypothetical protein
LVGYNRIRIFFQSRWDGCHGKRWSWGLRVTGKEKNKNGQKAAKKAVSDQPAAFRKR